MYIFNIPTKSEVFSVAARRLTENELLRLAHEIIDTAGTIMREDPRQWTSYDAFIGFRLGVATTTYSLEADQIEILSGLLCTHCKNRKAA